jgi:hypothetical protein
MRPAHRVDRFCLSGASRVTQSWSLCALSQIFLFLKHSKIVCRVAPHTRERPYVVNVVLLRVEFLAFQISLDYGTWERIVTVFRLRNRAKKTNVTIPAIVCSGSRTGACKAAINWKIK